MFFSKTGCFFRVVAGFLERRILEGMGKVQIVLVTSTHTKARRGPHVRPGTGHYGSATFFKKPMTCFAARGSMQSEADRSRGQVLGRVSLSFGLDSCSETERNPPTQFGGSPSLRHPTKRPKDVQNGNAKRKQLPIFAGWMLPCSTVPVRPVTTTEFYKTVSLGYLL